MTKDAAPRNEKKTKVSTLSWFILVACVFLFRTHVWTTAELWYDETLNLQRFILPHLQGDGVAGVFTDYPIANNHMLATAMHVLWLQTVGLGFNEFILRFPDLICALATIAIVMGHWQRHLGKPLAALTGLLLAISPVFTAYAYQLRGYALTMLLATIAVSGALELLERRHVRGQALLCLSGLLLPLVMPSNLMLVPAMAVLMVALQREQDLPWKQALLTALPWCLASLLGAAYYLTILEQVRKALAEPNGWNSATLVAGNLLLAFLAHTGALLFPACLCALRKRLPLTDARHRTTVMTTLAMLATILATFVVAQSGHMPFPRVYLVLLPVATFLAVRWSKPVTEALIPSASMLAVTILVMGILVERISEGVTDYQLKQGYIPDNLLQQYYRGATDLREIATNRNLDLKNTLVITDPYDEMSLSMYVALSRQQPNQPLNTLVAGSNRIPNLKLPQEIRNVLVVAHSKEAATALITQAGITQPLLSEQYKTASERRRVFKLVMPKRPIPQDSSAATANSQAEGDSHATN